VVQAVNLPEDPWILAKSGTLDSQTNHPKHFRDVSQEPRIVDMLEQSSACFSRALAVPRFPYGCRDTVIYGVLNYFVNFG